MERKITSKNQPRAGSHRDWDALIHLVNFFSGIRAHLSLTATMGRSVLKNERMKERIHAVFTTNISIALPLIVLILLIAVTYFHEMRSEDRATGTGEMPFLQQDIQGGIFL